MDNTKLAKRHIRVFISSTFQKMEGEREYLMKRTFHKLRELAAKRNVLLTEVDLRWGITLEESQSGKVVDICLREIENSIPFFIGIIGNRYGWIPKPTDLTAETTRRFPSVNNYLERELSVTEMEMQFGVLERPEDMHAYFFIREEEKEDERPDNPAMLEKLKNAVKESRYPSSYYSSLEDLAAQVEAAFISLLDDLFPEEPLSEHQKQRIIQQSFINRLGATYVRNDGLFRQITGFVENSTESCYVVTGDSGMGKSALLANWASENMDSKSLAVIPYFCSNGGNQTYSHILQYLTEEICETYGIIRATGSTSDTEGLKEAFDQFAIRKEELVIVIDAINQIADIDNAKQLNWLPAPPHNVKYIFSTLKDDATMEVFQRRKYPILHLQALSPEQKHQLVVDHLGQFGKNLDDGLVSRILAGPRCDNTLVLKTILDELIYSGTFETLKDQIEYYLNCSSIPQFYGKVLARYEKDFGAEFIKKVLCLIAVSRTGVSEEELIRLTGVRQLEWSEFFCSFSTHLSDQSGRYVFTHSYITASVWQRYLDGHLDNERDCRRLLAGIVRETPNTNAMMEVPYQLEKLEDWDQLHDFITSIPYLRFGMDFNEFEVSAYWRRLMFETIPGKYSILDYLDHLDGTEDRVQLYLSLLQLCRNIAAHDAMEELAGLLLNMIKEHPELAGPKVYQALSLSKGQPDKIEFAKKSLSICEEKKDVPEEIVSLRLLGSAYYDAAAVERDDSYGVMAYDVWKRETDLIIQYYGETHPLVMHAYEDMSMVYDSVHPGDWEGAMRLARKALKLGLSLYGNSHPLTARPYHYIGVIYRDQGMWAEALPFFQKAYDIWFPAYGLHHDVIHSALVNQGRAHLQLGQYADALSCFNKCLEVEKNICKEDLDFQNAAMYLNLARTYKAMGRLGDARKACEACKNGLDRYTKAEGQREELQKKYQEFMAGLNEA